MRTEPLLQKLANHRPAENGRSTFEYQDNATGWNVAMTTDVVDALSVQLWDVTVSRNAPATPISGQSLREAGQRVADRVTGLMEPLRLLEVDAERHEAVLRSEAPTVRRDQRQHYEVRLAGTHQAGLRRFQAGVAASSKREQIPFVLTKEVLAKYLEDMTEALA